MKEIRLAPLGKKHRSRLAQILVATGAFSGEEVEIALELFDDVFTAPKAGADYEFVGAFSDRQLLGYGCYGPTPATDGTWDLYWLAVDPSAQGRGIGRQLVRWVEQDLGRRGARLLVVETSSRADYEQTRSFYARGGYVESARVRDFYSPHDDRIILTTRLSGEAGVVTQ